LVIQSTEGPTFGTLARPKASDDYLLVLHNSLQRINSLFPGLGLRLKTSQVTFQSLDGRVGHIDVLPMTIQSIPMILVLLEVVLQNIGTILVLLAELNLQVVSLEGSQLMSYDEQLADLTLASNCITLDNIRIIIAVEWRIAGVVWLRRSFGASQSRMPILSKS